jgi:hypothetical protein
MLEALAVVIRFVPATVAFVIMTAWFVIVSPLAFLAWLAAAPLWALFVLPFKFIGAALSNDLQSFRRDVSKSVDDWHAAPANYIQSIGSAYSELLGWLLGVS